jgi:flagellar hook-associated protein 3 FlgL
MGVPTVSTYSVIQRTINDVNKVQNDLFDQQIQLSSGKKSQDFVGIANQTQEYLSLDAAIGKSEQYMNDNQLVSTRLNSTANALSNIVTIGNNLQNLISQRRTGVSNSAAFPNQLDGLWKQLTTELNSAVNNQYLFSGTKTNQQAVDTTNYPTLQTDGVPDAGYFKGSHQNITALLQDNTAIQYNVRADEPAFQKMFAALAMAKKAHNNQDDNDMKKAYDLVQGGIQDVISVQAVVNSNKVQVSGVVTSLQNLKLYWQGIQESIGNTDVIGVSTQVAINQGILQAAFQAFAKISSLKLADFLR